MLSTPGGSGPDTRSVDFRSDLVDRRALIDAALCPACGASLERRTTCPACGVELSGSSGLRLWQLSRTAAGALDERVALLETLTAQAAARRAVPRPSRANQPNQSNPVARAAGFVPGTQGGGALADGAPVTIGGQPFAPSAASRRAPQDVAPAGVQRLLVGVGAFLVAVAVIGFLAFSWSSAGLGARAVIV